MHPISTNDQLAVVTAAVGGPDAHAAVERFDPDGFFAHVHFRLVVSEAGVQDLEQLLPVEDGDGEPESREGEIYVLTN
jgi:hypothetical protein